MTEEKDKKEKSKTGIEDKPKSLEEKLTECEKLKEEYLAGWQRARADFLNYKKEEGERIEKCLEYVQGKTILRILPVLDNFEKALKEMPNVSEDDKIKKGLFQIKTQFEEILKNLEVDEIKAVGEKFDPNFHEAIEEVDKETKESGRVVEVLQKGYLLNGQLLRPAKVKVGK